MNKKLILISPLLALPHWAEAKQPNIVFILADDMGYGDVSCLNPNSKIKTPNLDALAQDGVIYTDAHTSSSVSTPTRYGVLTGRYNWRTTLKKEVCTGFCPTLIAPNRETMGSMLQKQGYTTAAIGKWHLGWNWAKIDPSIPYVKQGLEVIDENVDYSKPVTNSVNSHGFDYSYMFSASLDIPPYVYVENGMPTAEPNRSTLRKGKYHWWRKGPTAPDFEHEQTLPHITQKACDYIHETAKSDKPYFLYLPFPAPHTPILPTAEFLGKSGIGVYGDFTIMVDAMVGRVMQAVAATGEAENTIIVFTADNGCSPAAGIDEMIAQGHYPNSIYRGHKADLFEGGHRVPCIVKWTKKAKPHIVNQTICLTDFYATFAEISKHKLNDTEAEDSYSILPTLRSTKEGKTIREATVHHSVKGEFAIRKGEWKLLFSASSGGWSKPRPDDAEALKNLPKVQLYNIKTDPSEKENLQAEYPHIVQELTELMIKYVKDGRSTPGEPQKNDGPQHWEQLSAFMSK